MKLCRDIDADCLVSLLQPYNLELREVDATSQIPGSFWGESEAGLIRNSLYFRYDTPAHSVLHEAAHYICMSPERRLTLHTDAGGSHLEEAAVCYLQIVLAGHCPCLNRPSLMRDMDTWGYSFRLGSTRAWFEQDADNALEWLIDNGLLQNELKPTWRLRS